MTYKALFFPCCLAVAWIIISMLLIRSGAGDVIFNNPAFIELVGIIFSVLTASLLAVITIFSDISFLLKHEEDWTSLWNKSNKQLARNKILAILFAVYLLTLILLAVITLLSEAKISVPFYLTEIFIILATLDIISAFYLPFQIIEFQRDKLSRRIAELKKRKKI